MIQYAYNSTTNEYHHLPLAGKRADAFVLNNPQFVLHSKEQYNAWFERNQPENDNFILHAVRLFKKEKREKPALPPQRQTHEFYDMSHISRPADRNKK